MWDYLIHKDNLDWCKFCLKKKINYFKFQQYSIFSMLRNAFIFVVIHILDVG